MGMADRYYAIDPAGEAVTREELHEVYCGTCDTETEVWVEEAYAYGVWTWCQTWTCPLCQCENEDEGEMEYDPTDGED